MTPTLPKLPPGPRSRFPGDTMIQLRRGPLEFLTRLTQTYGDIATFKSLGQRYVVLNHPDLAKEVLLTQADAFWKGPALQNSKAILGEGLLTAEGDAHKQQRRLIQPAFHAKHVETYSDEVTRTTTTLIADLKSKLASNPAPLDIRPQMMALTLIIAGRALFGTFLESQINTVHRCMDDLMNNYIRSVVPWGKLLNYLPLPSTLKLANAQNDLFSLIDHIIKDRRNQIENQKSKIENPPDLLSMMLAATDSECPAHATPRMTDKQLRDQCITILTAGHETTANAMTFTLYLLAQHPEEQQKLRQEIPQDSPLKTQDLLSLPRTRHILSESMRLYPPAWTLGRQNQRPIQLAGFHIPKKSTLLIPQWTLHRDPRFFPNPLAFTPDRWQNPDHPRHAYLPFSTGPRNCIGESFAWLEMLIALPMLIQNFHFTLPQNSPPMQLVPAITLRPRNPVPLLITPA